VTPIELLELSTIPPGALGEKWESSTCTAVVLRASEVKKPGSRPHPLPTNPLFLAAATRNSTTNGQPAVGNGGWQGEAHARKRRRPPSPAPFRRSRQPTEISLLHPTLLRCANGGARATLLPLLLSHLPHQCRRGTREAIREVITAKIGMD
jgi:hypothetical protein